MWRLYMGSDVSAGPLPIPDDYSAAQKRAHEIESFGFLASRHPLTLYRPQIERLQPVPASQMHRFVGRRITMVGVLITSGYDAVSAPRNQTEKPPAQICTGAFPFMGLKPTSDTSGPRYAHQTPSRSAP